VQRLSSLPANGLAVYLEPRVHVPRLGGARAVNQESLDAGATGSSKLSLTALYVSYINGI